MWHSILSKFLFFFSFSSLTFFSFYRILHLVPCVSVFQQLLKPPYNILPFQVDILLDLRVKIEIFIALLYGIKIYVAQLAQGLNTLSLSVIDMYLKDLDHTIVCLLVGYHQLTLFQTLLDLNDY